MNEAKPTLGYWIRTGFLLFAAATTYSVLIAFGFIWVAEKFGYKFESGPQNLPYFVVLYLPVLILISYWQLRDDQTRNYWKLTETELLRGNPLNLRIKLTDIVEIGKGLPLSSFYRAPKDRFIRFLTPGFLKHFEFLYDTSLVLRVGGGLLLLQLSKLNGGAELVNELLNRCSNLVNSQVEYTEEERRVLKLRDRNKLLKL